MNSYNLINPKRDVVFKRIFGKRGNEGILKDFLESLLEIKIDSLSLDINTELVPDFADGKVAKVDVLARLSDGTLVNIEIQMDQKKNKIAQKLKVSGMPISQIAEITELTEEEIERL